MNESYKIEVSITPDFETSPEKPYHWTISKHTESDWVIEDYHWASSAEEAWKEAWAEWCKSSSHPNHHLSGEQRSPVYK